MDNNQIVNFLYAAMLSGIPFLFGTLGEILTERTGNLNLGVEGMMAMGAIAGFYFGYITNSVVLAILFSFISGAATALIYAVLTITLKANQSVTGLTITIFAVGLANFLGDAIRMSSGESVLKLPDSFTENFTAIHIPYLSDIPVIGKLIFGHNMFLYFGVVLCIGFGLFIFKTRRGLNMKAVGENPASADAAGISVNMTRYIYTLIGGGICGIGGAYISLALCGGVWVSDCIGGLGWIAVALVIFANWNPYFCILGSFVFGGFRVLKFYFPKNDLFIIPDAVFDMMPFLITAVVLIFASVRSSKKVGQPAGLGSNYFREER